MRLPVVRQQFRDLRTRDDVEQIRGAGVTAAVVATGRADDGDGAIEGDGPAEAVSRLPVVREQFGDLCAGDGVEQIGRTGAVAVVVIVRRPDDGNCAVDRDGVAEEVLRSTIVRKQFRDLRTRGRVEQVRGAGEITMSSSPNAPTMAVEPSIATLKPK
jgi:hypothetical protein